MVDAGADRRKTSKLPQTSVYRLARGQFGPCAPLRHDRCALNTPRDALLKIENWQKATFDEQAKDGPSARRRRKGTPPPDATALRPGDATVSPLDLYVYLKVRFGPPNDIMMVARGPGLENIIQ